MQSIRRHSRQNNTFIIALFYLHLCRQPRLLFVSSSPRQNLLCLRCLRWSLLCFSLKRECGKTSSKMKNFRPNRPHRNSSLKIQNCKIKGQDQIVYQVWFQPNCKLSRIFWKIPKCSQVYQTFLKYKKEVRQRIKITKQTQTNWKKTSKEIELSWSRG